MTTPQTPAGQARTEEQDDYYERGFNEGRELGQAEAAAAATAQIAELLMDEDFGADDDPRHGDEGERWWNHPEWPDDEAILVSVPLGKLRRILAATTPAELTNDPQAGLTKG